MKTLIAGQELAKVDGLHNLYRRDQKFPVVILEDRIHATADAEHDIARRYTCHWCKFPVWGINRQSIEVLVQNGENFERQTIDVHTHCQIEREKQMALIPFSSPLVTVAAS